MSEIGPSATCGERLAARVRRVVAFACLTAVLAAPAGAAEPADLAANKPPGLVAEWPANGNARDVVGHNDGQLVGHVLFVRGKIGRAFGFDGRDDYVRVKDAFQLTPRVITVACWFSAKSTPASAFFDIIPLVNKFHHNTGTAEEDSYALGLTLDGGVRWQVETVRDYGIDDNILAVFANDVPGLNTLDGKLHHIAGTYDGTRMIAYVDGVAIGSLSATGPVNNGPVRLLFGAAFNVDSISWFQKGRLDDIRIYNRALNAREIARLARRH